ncbi:PIG-L deacetylase family protein [Acidicapsa ligni]|uniref:PIG-L deacetylase family protein n=1 Tax=Acidicapsa ligni TaxID=542300 RepID=UPI0021DF43ED|nr:PIG-L deacetylase family protein [Acidicapsa ligni]
MIVPLVSEVEWRNWLAQGSAWPPTAASLMIGRGPVLVVAPHPDDETLGAGGLIANLRSTGVKVIVAAVTDGENAYEGIPGLGPLREKEQTNALSHLGVTRKDIFRFRIIDSGVSQHEDELAVLLEPLVRRSQHVIAPWVRDFHPDHEACGRVAERLAFKHAVELTSYLFWTWHRGTPDSLSGLSLVHIPLTEQLLDQKLQALVCHRSQLEREEGDPILSERLLAPARRNFETYLPSRVTHER